MATNIQVLIDLSKFVWHFHIYNVILQTPREKQRLTVWSNVFNNYRDIMTVNHIIKITGKIGFGGITVDGIWDAKANYN